MNKNIITNSKWFGVVDYKDKIMVGQDLKKLVVKSKFGDKVEDVLESEMAEYKGCYVIDEFGFSFGDSKEEVVDKLKNMIVEVEEV
jgi:hypothetical protein